MASTSSGSRYRLSQAMRDGGERAVAAPVPAQSGQRDEDLAGVSNDVRPAGRLEPRVAGPARVAEEGVQVLAAGAEQDRRLVPVERLAVPGPRQRPAHRGWGDFAGTAGLAGVAGLAGTAGLAGVAGLAGPPALLVLLASLVTLPPGKAAVSPASSGSVTSPVSESPRKTLILEPYAANLPGFPKPCPEGVPRRSGWIAGRPAPGSPMRRGRGAGVIGGGAGVFGAARASSGAARLRHGREAGRSDGRNMINRTFLP